MRKILVTGGTVFVSKFVASYFVKIVDEVYALNRNHHKQCEGVHLIEADRHDLKDISCDQHFDVILDVTVYNEQDIHDLLDSKIRFDQYIFISSSVVYPEDEKQPFKETSRLSENKFWGQYGTDKIAAEKAILKRVPDAYIIRPPYLYGPMNNVYREAFVFERALQKRPFYLPKDGSMKLHFFYIEDLCKFIDIIIEKRPTQHIFNVGNHEMISIKDWVDLCYQVVGEKVRYEYVDETIPQRSYFNFYDYEYVLDVTSQNQWLCDTTPLSKGLEQSFKWYINHKDEVIQKPYFAFIDENLK